MTATVDEYVDAVEQPAGAARTVMAETGRFTAYLAAKDRELRRRGTTVPSVQDKEEVNACFRALFARTEQLSVSIPATELAATKDAFRAALAPWLLRSRFFWRSTVKPQGYAGDYRMIDEMYDLEDAAGDDPSQAAVVNCLDHVVARLESIVSLWERRRWLRDLVSAEIDARANCLVLDVACGGARYLGDATRRATSAASARLTLVDQDPAALHFARTVNLADTVADVRIVSTPIKRMFDELDQRYDVVISAGLFDYLPQDLATGFVTALSQRLAPGGVLALTNYHVDDPSEVVRDWSADWPLILRGEDQMLDVFSGSGLVPEMTRSANGSLLMACARKSA